MSSNFECFVQINDNKYDISIDKRTDSMSFQDIYPKIKQIVKIAENVDIDLKTHEFVNFDKNNSMGQTLNSLTQVVKNLSMIYISKQLPENENIIGKETHIREYHSIVMAIDKQLINVDIIWEKVLQKVNTICDKTYSDSKDLISIFNRFTNYYAENYDIFNGKVGPKSQQIFDLLKVIHTLNVNKIKHCPHKIKLILIESTQQHKDYFQKNEKRINDEKEKLKVIYNSRIEDSMNKIEEKNLRDHKSHIKDYHSVVIAINIGWDFRNHSKYWTDVYRKSKITAESYIKYGNIAQFFFKWTHYYAQNYSKINNKLSESSQQIFNLLKIVHVLDLDRIYSPSSDTSLKIKAISELREFQNFYNKYLIEIRREKIRTKEVLQLSTDNRLEDSLTRTRSSVSRLENSRKRSKTAVKRSKLRKRLKF